MSVGDSQKSTNAPPKSSPCHMSDDDDQYQQPRRRKSPHMNDDDDDDDDDWQLPRQYLSMDDDNDDNDEQPPHKESARTSDIVDNHERRRKLSCTNNKRRKQPRHDTMVSSDDDERPPCKSARTDIVDSHERRCKPSRADNKQRKQPRQDATASSDNDKRPPHNKRRKQPYRNAASSNEDEQPHRESPGDDDNEERHVKSPPRSSVKRHSRANEEPLFVDLSDNGEPVPKKRKTRKRDSTKSSKRNKLREDDSSQSLDIVGTHLAKLPLTKQPPRLRQLLDAANKEALKFILFTNTFPAGPEKNGIIIHQILIKCAESLDDTQLAKMIKRDMEYSDHLVSVPSQRISLLRKDVKEAAQAHDVGVVFGVKAEDIIKILWLQAEDRFVYPCDFENDHVSSKLFTNPLWASLLRICFFQKSRLLGNVFNNLMSSSLPSKPDEKEIPAPMLALIATAVYYALDDLRLSESPNFSTDSYACKYRDIIGILSDLRDEGPNQYHTLMHRLYNKAQSSRPTASSSAKTGPSRRNKFLNIAAMDV
ncbi:uncharacterized protein BXZ73DRAFT_101061 [Epithele typhae]|uniref:uncharacterized protein n=1 Tax=Epithele typhae TaxID=378194 RepID=UPI00200731F1|nr:uncharacterized protein BXZ73DRAFT_101061 [Epithele typhae]KAH9933676.1 hypothetical protein BXZ73DRAFT_101061 [Epithele typhae]